MGILGARILGMTIDTHGFPELIKKIIPFIHFYALYTYKYIMLLPQLYITILANALLITFGFAALDLCSVVELKFCNLM
jgi:hypothetical protein